MRTTHKGPRFVTHIIPEMWNTLGYWARAYITAVKSFKVTDCLGWNKTQINLLWKFITLFKLWDNIFFWRQVNLSTCHFVKLPRCQLAILSIRLFVNLWFCQFAILLTCHLANLPMQSLLVTCHFSILPFYQNDILSTKNNK